MFNRGDEIVSINGIVVAYKSVSEVVALMVCGWMACSSHRSRRRCRAPLSLSCKAARRSARRGRPASWARPCRPWHAAIDESPSPLTRSDRARHIRI